MAPSLWKLLLATVQLSSCRQCSATESCDEETTLLQSHVTKTSMGLAAADTHHLNFPHISSLTDPDKRKMALAQFEETATELASNRAAVTPIVVEVCNSTSELLRDTVMSAIVHEHDTDVASLAAAYAVFGSVEQQRLEYEQLILNAMDSVYGDGGLIEVHTECRIRESEQCAGCAECEDTCTEVITDCELAEVELRLRLNDVISQVDRDAYCDANGHIRPPSSETVITQAEHEVNRPAFNAYLAALAAFEECEVRKTIVCESCEVPETTGTSLLAVSQRLGSTPVVPGGEVPDAGNNPVCRNHTDIRVECNTIQQQLQAAACDSRHLASNYLSLYEAAFLAAVRRYNQVSSHVRILEADRKVEWDTLERVICLLMTLTNPDDGAASSVETQNLIAGCRNDDVDTSHLDIVYLPTPDMGDLPTLPPNPCEDEFADEHYAGLPQCAGIADYLERIDHGILSTCMCFADAPEERHYGFPWELGPFLLFNAGFELNSASGFQVTGAGDAWTAVVDGAQYTGRISPFVAVSLEGLNDAFGLSGSDSVAQVAWVYGDPQGTTDLILHGEDYPETMQHRFVRTGGYVYRNAQGFVVALKEMSPSSDSLGQTAQLTIYFGDPGVITEAMAISACPQMAPITLGRLLDAGAEEYCWEFSNAIPLCDHGCFLYKTVTHGYLAFPVVEGPAIDRPEHYAATDQQAALEHSMHTGHLAATVPE